MVNLEASTKYNDFRGTAAADTADNPSLKEWMVSKAHMTDSEVILGVQILFSDNYGTPVPDPGIIAYVAAGPLDRVMDLQKAGQNVEVRVIGDLALPIADFLAFYKRFDVVLIRSGVEIPEVRKS